MRQAGQLDEALYMASELLVQSPNDVWAWRAWAWVKFDQLKLAQSHHLQFAEILQELWTMPSLLEEPLLVEQISWQLVKHGYSLLKAGEGFLPKLITLFENAWFNRLEFAVQNTDVRSALLGLALKIAGSWDLFIPFVRSFDLSKSSLKDFEKEFLPNGQNYPALVERTLIAVAKRLLPDFEQLSADEQGYWLSYFEWADDKEPSLLYVKYYRVKLLLKSSDQQGAALTVLLPFARSKSHEFWVWELLSLCVNSDLEKLACLCKAVLCKTQESFLINVKQQLALLLLQMGKLSEAKSEVQACISIREQNSWHVSASLRQLTQESWFHTTEGAGNMIAFYQQQAKLVQSLLYRDLPMTEAVITEINAEKKWLKYITQEGHEAGFPYHQLWPKPERGQLVTLYLSPSDNKKVHWVQALALPQGTLANWMESYEGTIKFTKGGFGFVDNIYIASQLLKERNITQVQTVKGTAVKVYDPVKKQLGKKALTVEIC